MFIFQCSVFVVMEHLSILNRKQIKEIMKSLEQQWGFTQEVSYAFLLSGKHNIYIVNQDLARIDLAQLNINSIGLYFAEQLPHGIRLSIEGSQLVGPHAQRNVIELSDGQLQQWVRGYSVDMAHDAQGFLIVKHGRDYFGCGKISRGKLLNYYPKSRRITSSDDPNAVIEE